MPQQGGSLRILCKAPFPEHSTRRCLCLTSSSLAVKKAENLPNVSPWWATSPQDPYVLLALGNSRQRSRVSEDGGQNPSWGEQFIFEPVVVGHVLDIQILDRNTVRKDKLIGTCRLAIDQAVVGRMVEVRVPVMTVRGTQQGTLHMDFELTMKGLAQASSRNPHQSFRPTPSIAPTPAENPDMSRYSTMVENATRRSSHDPSTSGRSVGSSNGSMSRPQPSQRTPEPEQLPVWIQGPTEDIRLHYEIGRELGKGNFGVTYLATCRKTARLFAVKSLSKRKMSTIDDFEDAKREIQILRHLKGHPNIVALEAVYEDRAAVHIVMEYCAGGELFDSIIKRTTYSELDAANTIRTIVSVVAFCHEKGVMHRDLKPENFMLSASGPNAVLKAIDFGISVFFKEGQVFRDISGTPFYTAPEVLEHCHGKSADIFACGVILFILLSGRPPFYADTHEKIYRLIHKGEYDIDSEPWPGISSGAKDLVRRMLAYDPSRRITTAQILEHPWLREGAAAAAASGATLDLQVVSRMRQFAAGDRLKQMARMALARNMPLKDMAHLKALFQSIDTDGSGTITLDELVGCLGKLGKDMGKRELQHLMADLDVNGDGRLDYQEFLAATMDLGMLQREDNLIKAFEKFDDDGNGYICRDELAQLLQDPALGMDSLEDVNTEDLLRQIDQDGDGRIDLQEFMLWMRSL